MRTHHPVHKLKTVEYGSGKQRRLEGWSVWDGSEGRKNSVCCTHTARKPHYALGFWRSIKVFTSTPGTQRAACPHGDTWAKYREDDDRVYLFSSFILPVVHIQSGWVVSWSGNAWYGRGEKRPYATIWMHTHTRQRVWTAIHHNNSNYKHKYELRNFNTQGHESILHCTKSWKDIRKWLIDLVWVLSHLIDLPRWSGSNPCGQQPTKKTQRALALILFFNPCGTASKPDWQMDEHQGPFVVWWVIAF